MQPARPRGGGQRTWGRGPRGGINHTSAVIFSRHVQRGSKTFAFVRKPVEVNEIDSISGAVSTSHSAWRSRQDVGHVMKNADAIVLGSGLRAAIAGNRGAVFQGTGKDSSDSDGGGDTPPPRLNETPMKKQGAAASSKRSVAASQRGAASDSDLSGSDDSGSDGGDQRETPAKQVAAPHTPKSVISRHSVAPSASGARTRRNSKTTETDATPPAGKVADFLPYGD